MTTTFSDSWNEFAAADADVSVDAASPAPNDIMSWDKPPPIDESWGDPLGLKSKEAGAFVEKEADGVASKSVASRYLESYMNGSDKAQKASTTDKAAAPQENSSAAESILAEKPKSESSAASAAIPVMATMAGTAGGKKSSQTATSPTTSASIVTAAPTLNANFVDDLFKRQATRPSQEGPPGTGWSTSEIKTDGMDRSKWQEDFGWNLGGNNTGSFIKRGAAAIGLDRMASQAPVSGNGEWSGGPNPDRWASDYKEYQKQLTEMAQQLGMDVSSYYNTVAGSTTGQGSKAVVTPDQQVLDANRLYDAIDERYKDVYLVGGMAQGLPGQTGNTGQKAVQAIYVRNGDKLVPTGTAKVYDAPENSHGFFGDAFDLTKEMAVDVMSDPVLATIVSAVTAGASAPIASSIGQATGMGMAASNITTNALIRAGTAAVTGGNPLKAAVAGAITGGIAELNPGAAIAPEAGAATQRAINSAIGTTVATGNPLDGLKTAGFGLAMDAISPEIAKAVSDATGIDPKNSSALTSWALQNAPALLQGRNLTPGQVMSLISASTTKKEKA